MFWTGVDLEKVADICCREGGVLAQSVIDSGTVKKVKDEIKPFLGQIAFNDIPGYTISGDSIWIDHLGIASPTAMRIAVDHQILAVMEQIFGEPAVLAECRYQKKISTSSYLPIHSDGAGGILIFVYLTEINDESAQTFFLKNTHDIRTNELFVSDEELLLLNPSDNEYVTAAGEPGTALFFDQDVWHGCTAGKPGRELLWFLYQPMSRTNHCIDHWLRQSVISGLDTKQLKALGIYNAPHMRLGSYARVGKALDFSDLKTLVKYFLKTPNIVWKAKMQTPTAKDKSQHIEARIRRSR